MDIVTSAGQRSDPHQEIKRRYATARVLKGGRVVFGRGDRMMKIHPIRTDAYHGAALKRIDNLMEALPGTPEADELDVLVTSRGRVSEVLNGRRALSLQMIRRLNRELGIPLESLVGPD